MEVLRTIHGSRLYGTEHPGSDYDTYVVSTQRKTRQRVNGDDDVTVVNLDDFLAQVAKGVPQALEALFSPVKQVHPGFAPMLNGLRAPLYDAMETYGRTVKSFYNKGLEQHSAKHLRHAIRLQWNAQDLGSFGYFNPRLTRFSARLLDHLASDALSGE